MLYSNDRGTLRDVFFNAWKKHEDRAPLDAMETMIVDVLNRHPEYQPIVSDPERNRERDTFPEVGETNPFMHMGMHLTVIEQLRLNQPAGVREQFAALAARVGDEHAAEHLVMETLAQWLGEGPPHEERDYIERLTRLAATRT